MGISQSQRQDFQERYQLFSGGRVKKRESLYCAYGDSALYQAVFLESTIRGSADNLKDAISNKMSRPSPYVTPISECFIEEGSYLCGQSTKLILVYQVGGINLHQTLKMRQQQPKLYSQIDAIYVIECILQALSYYERQGEEYVCLTPSCVVVGDNLVVGLVDTFLISNQSRQMRMDGEAENRVEMVETRVEDEWKRAEAGWVDIIKKIDDNKGDQKTFNLMSLGLIALEMVILNFKLDSFRVIRNGKEEYDWLRFRQTIKTLKNDQLREKIWILTSEYPRERLDIFDSMNAHFSNQNFPREILLRGTTFGQDLKLMKQMKQRSRMLNAQSVQSLVLTHISDSKPQYSEAVPNYTFQSVKQDMHDKRLGSQCFYAPIQQQPVSILREEPVPLNRSHRITFNMQKSDILSKSTPSSVIPEFKTQPCLGQLSPDNDFIIYNTASLYKIKSQKSEQTRKSNLITNSDMKNSRKQQVECEQPYFLEHSFDEAMNQQKSSKQNSQNQKMNSITQIQIQSDDQKLENLLDQQESFVLVDVEDDEQSEQAIRADINDIFNINTRHYAIDRAVEEEWNPIHLKEDFSRGKSSFIDEIIEEESVENSVTEEEQPQTEFVLEEYSSGSRYEGYKKNGFRHGYGKFHFQSGQIYDGDWKNNKMDGYGKLYYSQSILAYEGYWKNDCFHGRGKLYNENPAFMKTSCDYNDLSQCENNWMVYEGYFSEDLRSGKGRLTFENGEYFQGSFRSNLAEGEGYFMRENGSLIHGLWKESILISLF